MKNKTTVPKILTHALLTVGVGCALAVCTASAQDTTAAPRMNVGEKVAGKLTNKEMQFVHKAYVGNADEVMMAELALKNGESAGVKEFAQMMITDHTKANTDLKQFEAAHGSDAPPADPTAEDKAVYDHLTTLKGTAFDTAYIQHAVTDHKKDVKEYKEAKGMVKDTLLLGYVDKTLPVIEGHLKHAETLEKKDAAASH